MAVKIWHKKLEVTMLVMMLGAILVALLGALYFIIPYRPMTYHSLFLGSDVCPGKLVSITVDYDIDENYFDGVHALEVNTDWVAKDVPGIKNGFKLSVSKSEIDKSGLTPGRTHRETKVGVLAPEVPGVWTLEVHDVLRGTQLGLPKPQELDFFSDNSATVLDPSDPQCGGR